VTISRKGSDVRADRVSQGRLEIIRTPSLPSLRLSGMSLHLVLEAPRCHIPGPQTMAFWFTTSMTPANWSSAPIGRKPDRHMTQFLPHVIQGILKFAPMRSILLMNAMREHGIWWLAPTVSMELHTRNPQKRHRAVQHGIEASTSAVKSTWPGVSMMLTRLSRPENKLARPPRLLLPETGDRRRRDRNARSRSCSIQSVTYAVIEHRHLWIRPV